jgi:cyanate lyase
MALRSRRNHTHSSASMMLVAKRNLTVNEAAVLLGITPVAVRAAIMRHHIREAKIEKVGAMNLIDPQEVERYRTKYLRGPRPRKAPTDNETT